MKPAKINFSKIKIPSFLNFIENEKKDSINSNIFQVENIQNGSPIEGISLNDFYDNVNKEINYEIIKSSILNKYIEDALNKFNCLFCK